MASCFRFRAVVGVIAAMSVLGLGGCKDSGSGGAVRVVASFYPLAWAAEQVGGDAVTVEDLTPSGGEAHDLQLTARQRIAVQDADLVLMLGKGFQTEVERAARDSGGRVVDLLEGLELLPAVEEELDADPHVWLDPVLMQRIVTRVGEELGRVDPDARADYTQRAINTEAGKLSPLGDSYQRTIATCSLKTLVTTHEAFAYLAKRYALTQLGLTGLTPDAEPSAAQIQKVRDAARRNEVGAVFYEASDEGRRIGESVAGDVGVPALPLNTLESDPAPNDYLSQMNQNLASLEQGLRCS